MTPRSRTAAERVEWRRSQIARHAFKMFVAKGFERATVREIARSAGISVGLIFSYFPSKASILKHVIDQMHGDIEVTLRSATEAREPTEALQALIEAFVRWVDAHHKDVLLTYRESKSLPRKELMQLTAKEQAIADIIVEVLEGGARQGLFGKENVRSRAHMIIILAHSWSFRHWAFGELLDREAYIAFAKEAALAIASHPKVREVTPEDKDDIVVRMATVT